MNVPRDDVRQTAIFRIRQHDVELDGEGDRHPPSRPLAFLTATTAASGIIYVGREGCPSVIVIVVKDLVFVPVGVARRGAIMLRHPLSFGAKFDLIRRDLHTTEISSWL